MELKGRANRPLKALSPFNFHGGPLCAGFVFTTYSFIIKHTKARDTTTHLLVQ